MTFQTELQMNSCDDDTLHLCGTLQILKCFYLFHVLYSYRVGILLNKWMNESIGLVSQKRCICVYHYYFGI